ncbi:MAG: hypothetical protein EYC69_07120, partial [Bacteroidetes bacterium]
KQFELTNHLGNVLAVVSDRKLPHPNGGLIAFYQPDITSTSDYYPFGMMMDGRSYSASEYRFGFNGKEKDDNVAGLGNQYDYGFRIYNSRLGRFLSLDPLHGNYPWYTPYQFSGNKPIYAIDLDGLEELVVTKPQYNNRTWISITYVYPNKRVNIDPIGTGGVDYISTDGQKTRKANLNPNSVEQVLYRQYQVTYFEQEGDKFIAKKGAISEAIGKYKSPPGSNPNNAKNYSVWKGFSAEIIGQDQIFFKNDKSSFSSNGVEGDFDEMKSKLDILGNILKNNPDVIATITGFTDKDADDNYNTNLSKNRVQQVSNYLIKKFGIDSKQILQAWKGETEANQDSKTSTDRKVEVTIAIIN